MTLAEKLALAMRFTACGAVVLCENKDGHFTASGFDAGRGAAHPTIEAAVDALLVNALEQAKKTAEYWEEQAAKAAGQAHAARDALVRLQEFPPCS